VERKEKILYICYLAWTVDLLLAVYQIRVLAALRVPIVNNESKWMLQKVIPCRHFPGAKENTKKDLGIVDVLA
jgi:hypothetical protein